MLTNEYHIDKRYYSYKRVDIRYRIIAVLLGILILATSIFGIAITAYAANDTTAVKKSNYVISDMDKARPALEGIARERQISALVYLKDAYTIRGEADAYSDNKATVASGQLLYITGVDADAGRNIWYKVQYNSDTGVITGFVEREFLACSDARFLDWEDKYITTVGREEVRSVTDCADIEAFPASYRDALYALKAKHPDWIFVKQNTGLDFNASVAYEGVGEYSLIWTKSCLSSWIESKYDNSWSYASDGIIAYYMDPRNFLTETGIFQFEQLTYNPDYHKESSVQKILNGTFMSGGIEGTTESYAGTFMSIAAKYNVSPLLQAARVKQEQGVAGTSPLISGNYPGFEGYYNYYNIGASSANPIADGLAKAKEKHWDSRIKSLDGGAFFISDRYIRRGQDTLYLQKFDVDASYDGLMRHQYMQNIVAPSSEASSVYKGYQAAGMLTGTPFVFRIPVYNNMPSGRATKPSTPDTLTVNMDKVENLPVEQSAVLIPYINGGLCEAYEYQYSSSDSSVAAVDDNGVITGKKPGNATITCKAGTAGSTTCTVSVIKADIAVSDVDKPELKVTYDPLATLSDISLPDNFAWTDPSTVPVVDNQGYTATYSPDNSRYNSLSMTLNVEVAKAKTSAAEIKVPSDVTVTAGSELVTAALPNHFKWADSTATVPNKAGDYKYKAIYCLDEVNYEPTEDIEINVHVECAEHRFSEWSEPKNGYITRTCEICGEKEKLKVDEKVTDEDCTTLGHDMVDGVCSRCGYEEPPLQQHTHEYSLSSDTATCTEDGVKTYTCSCGDSYTEESKATGHHMVGNKCDKCDYVYTPTAAVTPLPTTPVKTTPTVAATPTVGVTPTAGVTPTSVPTPTAGPTPTPTAKPTVIPTPTAGPTPTTAPSKAVAQITKIVVPTTEPTPTTAPTEQVQDDQSETSVETSPATNPETQTEEQPQIREIASGMTQAIKPIEKSEEKTAVANDNKQEPETVTETTEEPSITEIEVSVESSESAEPEDIVIDAGEGATWTIPGESSDAASQIDMTVTMGTDSIPEKAIEKLKTDDYMTLSIAYDGEFGFDAKLTVNTGEEHAGKYANLYYFNPNREKLELIDSVKTTVDGDATFDMKHASDYVITFTDKQMFTQSGSNTMLFIIMGIILAGGLGVLVFVLVKMHMNPIKDDDFYFDLDDDR